MAKKANKTVAFSDHQADQRLLQRVEQALAARKDGSFSALCKQALNTFLDSAESESADSQQQRSEIQQVLAARAQAEESRSGTSEAGMSEQLERTKTELEARIAGLQEQLERERSQEEQQATGSQALAQRLERLEARTEQQFERIQQKLAQLEQSWVGSRSQPAHSEATEPPDSGEAPARQAAEPSGQQADADTLVAHFGQLLDDF